MALHPEYLRAYRETAMDMLPASWHQRIHESAMRRAGGRVSGQARGIAPVSSSPLPGDPAMDMADISRSDDWSLEVPVLTTCAVKAEDGEHRLVYSTVYTPNLPDSHGDWASHEDIEAAAHRFLRDVVRQGPTADIGHDRSVIEDVWPVESYVAPADMEINGCPVKRGAWVICHEVGTSERAERIWQGVKSGELASVSLDGSAVMEEAECPV